MDMGKTGLIYCTRTDLITIILIPIYLSYIQQTEAIVMMVLTMRPGIS